MSRPRTKILGIDFGTVRVGLAVSDPDRKFSFPLDVLERRNRDDDGAFFRALVEREEIGSLVVGLPVHQELTSDDVDRIATAARAAIAA